MQERRKLRTLYTTAFTMIVIVATASGAPAGVQAPPGRGLVHASATTIVVTSTADSGPGTLHQAMEQAQSGDTITFDPVVFPPTAPATITITSLLPTMWRGNVTIDASDAGVILDGSSLPGDSNPGLQIVGSDGNTIQGLQISNFRPGRAIDISGDSQHNVIGGDRSIGAGPFGQGNLLSNNGKGIVMCQEGNSLNVITGNLIGTDGAGTSGLGNVRGIWICEGARGNIIGPDNVIAHNLGTGIVVEHSDSSHNTITQNSIHDNGSKGISLREGGNGELSAPAILDFDLAAGTVHGFTCPNCTVEIFSDSADEGEVYEGQAIADGDGVYAFAKGVSFTGPHLTATATDADGNTSEFSLPTSGTVGNLIVQQGNDLPRVRLVADRFEDLKDNRIGDTFPLDRHSPPCPTVEEDWPFAHVRDLNLKWVRLSIDPLELDQARSWGHYSQFDISPCHDEVIGFLAENDVTILMTIVYWDEELHAQTYPDYRNEEEIQDYLDYTRTIVRQFRGRVQYYEILNEAYFYVPVGDYINLIRRVVPVIREEDPDAKIVVGGTSNLQNLGFRNYLYGVIGSDIMPLVDGIATHPMYGASPQYDDVRQYYYDYPSLVQHIKDMASANGFTGEYFAEEMCWRTAINPFEWEPWEYTPIVAAKYYGRGIVMHLGMDVWAGIGGEFYWEIPPIVSAVRNLGTVMAGARAVGLPMTTQSAATNLVSYTFTLDNGDWLIALWTDGIAVDNDPGVEATLTLPGVSDHAVTGMDVLYGFQQQMVTSEEQGGLVIRDLLVKDYPILLRVSPTRSIFLPVVMKVRSGVPDPTPTVLPSPSPTATPSSTPSPTPTVEGSPSPTATLSPSPTATWTATSTSTATPTPTQTATTTVTPEDPATANCTWLDPFDEDSLAAGWLWVREDPSHWSLTQRPGFLRITSQRRALLGSGNNVANLLLRASPSGDFSLSARVLFQPTESLQAAGVLIYENDDSFVWLSRGYCGANPPACVGDGIYLDMEQEGAHIEHQAGALPAPSSDVYLMLERRGDTYQAYTSADGQQWLSMGEEIHAEGFEPTRVGLLVTNGNRAASEIPADFDFVCLTETGAP